MARVVVTNNYPLDAAWEQVSAGRMPSQHCWGVWEAHLREANRTFEWSFSTSNYLGALGRSLLPFVGDLRQQLSAFNITRHGGIIFAADQQSAILLCLTRRLRLHRRCVVVFLHNGPRNKYAKFWLKGASSLITFSDALRSRACKYLSNEQESIHVVPWGPGLESLIYTELLDSPTVDGNAAFTYDFVSAGRTNRNFAALREWVRSQKCSGVIHDGMAREVWEEGELRESRRSPSSYKLVLRDMMASRSVIIPLEDSNRISGLTEIADAIALRKPFFISRSSLLPFEPAAVGGGWYSNDLPVEVVRSASFSGETVRAHWNMRAYLQAVEDMFTSLPCS